MASAGKKQSKNKNGGNAAYSYSLISRFQNCLTSLTTSACKFSCTFSFIYFAYRSLPQLRFEVLAGVCWGFAKPNTGEKGQNLASSSCGEQSSAQNHLSPFLLVDKKKQKKGNCFGFLLSCLAFSKHQDDYQPDDYDCDYYAYAKACNVCASWVCWCFCRWSSRFCCCHYT